jgi:hypothetical protein
MSLLLYFIICSPSLTPAPAGSTETFLKYTTNPIITDKEKSTALPPNFFYTTIKSLRLKTFAPIKQNYQYKLIFKHSKNLKN